MLYTSQNSSIYSSFHHFNVSSSHSSSLCFHSFLTPWAFFFCSKFPPFYFFISFLFPISHFVQSDICPEGKSLVKVLRRIKTTVVPVKKKKQRRQRKKKKHSPHKTFSLENVFIVKRFFCTPTPLATLPSAKQRWKEVIINSVKAINTWLSLRPVLARFHYAISRISESGGATLQEVVGVTICENCCDDSFKRN